MGWIEIGNIRPRMMGAHDPAKAYRALDIVTGTGDGIVYIAKKDTESGTTITNAEYWAQLLDRDSVEEFVHDWLDAHPEATTTVQDGVITEAKISADFLNWIKKDYITPEMYGAVCDGVTDDSAALQAALNRAQPDKKTVLITKDMYINANLTVPSRVNVVGMAWNEALPKIIVGPNVTTLFNCAGIRNKFRELYVQNHELVQRDFDVFDMHGNSSYDIDSQIENVMITYAGRAVVVRGRNVDVHGGGIMHCRYGVYYDFPESATGLRGLVVEGVRFHGVGEEDHIVFEDSAAVYIKNDNGSNLTIRNCIADQGGTFLEGYATELLFENNFVESFAKPIINVVTADKVHPNTYGSWLITGNVFKGKAGQITVTTAVGAPENLIVIDHFGRVHFSNNKLTNSAYEAINLASVRESVFLGNSFTRCGMDDATRTYAFALTGDQSYFTDVTIAQNKALSSDMGLCSGDINTVAYNRVSTSENFDFTLGNKNVRVKNEAMYYTVWSGTAGRQTTIKRADMPDGVFLVKRNDGRSIWQCFKQGNYITTPSMVSAEYSVIDHLTWSYDSGTGLLTFTIVRQDTSAGAFSTLGTPIEILFKL